MNAPFLNRRLDLIPPLPRTKPAARRAGEALANPPPLPALHVKQGVEVFRANRADFDFWRLHQRLGFLVGIVCLWIAAMAATFAGNATFFVLAGLAFGAGALHARRRADSILQRSMAASLLEEGPGFLTEAA